MNENVPAYSAKFFSHIPKDWKLEPLKTLVKSDRKITYGIVQPGKHDPEGVLLIRGQDYMNGWVDKTEFFRVTPDLHKKFRRSTTTAGDVLLSIAGYTGTVAVVPDWIKEANLTQTTARIACDENKLTGPYLSYFLQGNDGQLQSKRYTKGSAQEGLNLEDIERFIVCFPPLPEQQKIAAILSSVDNVIEKTRAQIDKLKALKTGMMQELLTKGIGHPEYKESPIGKIPVSWQTGAIINYAQVSTGNKDTKDRVHDGRYPFFVRSQKVEKINSYSFDGEAVLTAGDGVGTGKVFHYINGRFDFHQRVYKISNFSDQLDGRFFFYFFSNNFILQVNRLSAKGSVDSVRREMITEMQIPLPSIAEQRKIAGAIKAVDERISATSERLLSLEATKSALMQDLLTGKVRVEVDQKESAVA